MRKIQDLRIFVTTYVDDLLGCQPEYGPNLRVQEEARKSIRDEQSRPSQVHSRHPGNSVRRTNNHQPRTLYPTNLSKSSTCPTAKDPNTPMEVGAKLVKATDSDTITSQCTIRIIDRISPSMSLTALCVPTSLMLSTA